LAVVVGGSGMLVGWGAVAGAGSLPEGSGTRAAAASCAALTPAQQLAAARVVLDGVMQAGPTTLSGGWRVLASPARVRVIGYLKGHGPGVVEVQTGSAIAGGGVVVNEDGIEPVAGQSWRIYSDTAREPFATSICAGSRLLDPSDVRSFTGAGVSFAYPAAWVARRYQVPSSFSSAIVFLSPQAMHPPCVARHGTVNTTITCTRPITRLDRDSILAGWSTNGWLGWSFARAPGRRLRVGAVARSCRSPAGVSGSEPRNGCPSSFRFRCRASPLSGMSSTPTSAGRTPLLHAREVRRLLRTVRFAS
jgi:hypothetical protein